MPIRVLIADDFSMIRRGLRVILGMDSEIEVLAEARDGLEAVRISEELKPNVVLLDMRMPTMNGVAATAAIKQSCPDTQVVILASVIDEAAVLDAVRAGAIGYLLKDTPEPDLIWAVKKAAAGQVQFCTEASQVLMHKVRTPERSEPLSQREREVLRLLTQGKTNKQIAGELGLGDKSVKTYVSNILAKLNCQSRTEAAAMATRMGLIGDL